MQHTPEQQMQWQAYRIIKSIEKLEKLLWGLAGGVLAVMYKLHYS